MIGGCVGTAKHRRLFETQPRRYRVAILDGGISQLGKSAEPMAAHHRIADLEPRHIGPDRDHFTRSLVAGDEGWFRSELILSGQHQHIDVLDATRPNPGTCTSPGTGAAAWFRAPRRNWPAPRDRRTPRTRPPSSCSRFGPTRKLAPTRVQRASAFHARAGVSCAVTAAPVFLVYVAGLAQRRGNLGRWVRLPRACLTIRRPSAWLFQGLLASAVSPRPPNSGSG